MVLVLRNCFIPVKNHRLHIFTMLETKYALLMTPEKDEYHYNVSKPSQW